MLELCYLYFLLCIKRTRNFLKGDICKSDFKFNFNLDGQTFRSLQNDHRFCRHFPLTFSKNNTEDVFRNDE